jgi:cell wall-associated NlpC family hydrolase
MVGEHKARLWAALRSKAAVLTLFVSLLFGRPTEATSATTRASATGEFPVFKPDDSNQFPKVNVTAMRVPKVAALNPEKQPVTKPSRKPSRTRLLLTIARQYIGVRYVWGGNTPSGFDCSGYTRYVYRKVGVWLPRISRDQARVGIEVENLPHARIGDLLFFGSPVHHVAIYVGRGMMLDAPHSGTVVQLRKVYDTPSAIRRVL